MIVTWQCSGKYPTGDRDSIAEFELAAAVPLEVCWAEVWVRMLDTHLDHL